MNKERILTLANHLENLPPDGIKFDMGTYIDFSTGSQAGPRECGTAACIAGHAALMFSDKDYISSEGVYFFAAELLGIDDYEADNLFLLSNSDLQFHHVTPHMAADTLRRFAETGVVQWPDD